jgi:hypothetical protein
MQTDQLRWSDCEGWQPSAGVRKDANLVLYFGTSDALRTDAWYSELRTMYPNAHIVGCSSGGQIQHAEISDIGIAAIAVEFAATRLRIATESVVNSSQSRAYGAALGRQLSDRDLVGVFVLSDGLNVNGSELVRGLLCELGSAVRVSGEHPTNDVVRTVLAVNREARSMIFAGDIPQGSKAQLMCGEFTRLAEGATEAASQAAAKQSEFGARDGPALLVSCIGRRLLMGQRIDDEIRAVRNRLSADVSQLGFYSYGEIAPHSVSGVCELHNQTMAVTIISEVLT